MCIYIYTCINMYYIYIYIFVYKEQYLSFGNLNMRNLMIYPPESWLTCENCFFQALDFGLSHVQAMPWAHLYGDSPTNQCYLSPSIISTSQFTISLKWIQQGIHNVVNFSLRSFCNVHILSTAAIVFEEFKHSSYVIIGTNPGCLNVG